MLLLLLIHPAQAYCSGMWGLGYGLQWPEVEVPTDYAPQITTWAGANFGWQLDPLELIVQAGPQEYGGWPSEDPEYGEAALTLGGDPFRCCDTFTPEQPFPAGREVDVAVFDVRAAYASPMTLRVGNRPAVSPSPTAEFEVLDLQLAHDKRRPTDGCGWTGPRQLLIDGVITVLAALDPSALGLITLVPADDPGRRIANSELGPLGQAVELYWSEPAADEDDLQRCVIAQQLDAAGRVAFESEVVCADATPAGCASAPGKGSALLALFALVLTRRRRAQP
ncbi:MAG: hypothetical protein H6740_20180 [Alphaproteobacteria bacterium]|nr:hypothetical protein [Alphaproteobacteria bacterium]